ncbi:TPA: CooT family nickel-binding protein [Candidatus Poribacteria bacterium]|nr:CooT family nickel-binding protein [Candidatus Poribacteria bacterium]
MCQATVYLDEKEVARDVIWLEQGKDGVRLATLFEEPQLIPGRVRHIDFMKHRVILEPLKEDDDEG